MTIDIKKTALRYVFVLGSLVSIAACAKDAPGVETHLVDDPTEGRVKVGVWPRGAGIYDVVVFHPGVFDFPSPYILQTRVVRTEIARRVLSDGRCGDQKPQPVDIHLEKDIQMMRFQCQ